MRCMRGMMTAGVLLVLWVPPSVAGGPASVFCSVPTTIRLVGSRAATPDAAGAFTIIVRNQVDIPMSGASVELDLSGCSDLSLCSDQLDPAATVNCAAKTVSKIADIAGHVSFIVLGRSNGAGNATTLLHGAKIYANAWPIGWPTASCFDLDGSNGVGINDLSVWLADFGTAGNPPYGRSDFDGDGAVDINDLSVWLGAFGAGGSSQGCAASCP